MDIINTQLLPLSKIEKNTGQIEGLPKNPRTIKDADYRRLVQSITDNPEMLSLRELLVYPHGGKFVIIGGNMRFEALRELGYKEAPVKIIPASATVEQLRAYTLKDNGSFGDWDFDLLANEWELSELEAADIDMSIMQQDVETPSVPAQQEAETEPSLFDRFVVPPFSILDSRQGYWQERKKIWRGVIGDCGASREDVFGLPLEMKYHDIYQRTRHKRKELGLSFTEYFEKYVTDEEKAACDNMCFVNGVSMFDPVLAEVLCRWFTPGAKSKIFDPFSGDTQKGLVFATLGHTFRGVELRQEQVDVNNGVVEGRGLDIEYICDDGRNIGQHIAPDSQDMLFSCPPYYDLEIYSDDERDASNQKTYGEFINIIRDAFASALRCLKRNRFAVIVVGDVREKNSSLYYDFTGDIKRIFADNGARLYNEIILVESGATAALRAARNMESRKVVEVHQNVLVFYKGDRPTTDVKREFEKLSHEKGDIDLFIMNSDERTETEAEEAEE
jgi:hypothetical protein